MKNRRKSQVKQETRKSSVDSVKKTGLCLFKDLAFLVYINTFSFNVFKCFEICVEFLKLCFMISNQSVNEILLIFQPNLCLFPWNKIKLPKAVLYMCNLLLHQKFRFILYQNTE